MRRILGPRRIFGTFCAAALVAACGGGMTVSAGVHTRSQARVSLTLLWTRSIALNADSAGAYIAHPVGHKGAILYILAGNNSDNCSTGNPVTRAVLYALDSGNGRVVWTRSTSGPSRCTTAGPVADPSGRWIYAPGLDGKMHRYAAGTGKEYLKKGWPERITLMPDVEKMSATARIAHGYLYVTTSGFIGDQGHYEGHLVTIKLSNGTAHVFNSLCSDIRQLLGPTPGRSNYCPAVDSGLFGRGQGVSDPVDGSVYVVSGNGPWNGRTNWGDTIMKLDRSGNRLLDSYTPTDQSFLAQTDQDLGSTGPALLRAIKQNGHTYRLLVQGGKGPTCQGCNGTALRLLNRDNLSGKGSPGNLGGDLDTAVTPGGCEVLTAPAIGTFGGSDWVIYADSCGSAGYRVTSPSAGRFKLTRVWSSRVAGSTPVLSGGVLYVAGASGLSALSPTTGSSLWHGSVGGIHWEYPLVTHGRLFMTNDNGKVMAFKIAG